MQQLRQQGVDERLLQGMTGQQTCEIRAQGQQDRANMGQQGRQDRANIRTQGQQDRSLQEHWPAMQQLRQQGVNEQTLQSMTANRHSQRFGQK